MQDNNRLKSMDKVQLLNIMRQQELEIQRLTVERDELLTRQQLEFEKLIDEKNELAKSFHDKDREIQRLNSEINELVRKQQQELTQLMQNHRAEIDKLAAEKAESKPAQNTQFNFPIEKAGSLAEASMIVSGIIKAAQDAADVYLSNIKYMEMTRLSAVKKIEEEARMRAEAMLRAAEMKSAEIEKAAEMKRIELERAAEMRRAELERPAVPEIKRPEFTMPVIPDRLDRNEPKPADTFQNVSNQYSDYYQNALNEMMQKYNIEMPVQNPSQNLNQNQNQADQTRESNPFTSGSNVKYEYIGNIGKYQPAANS